MSDRDAPKQGDARLSNDIKQQQATILSRTAKRIERWLARQSVSQAELARSADVSEVTVSRALKGSHQLSLVYYARLAATMQLSLDELLLGKKTSPD